MILIAVDPGATKPQAYAVFRDGLLTRWGSVQIDQLDEVIRLKPLDWCIVEDQFARKAPVKAIELAHVAGRIAEKAIQAGAKVHYLPPNEWQAAICGASRKLKRPERRKRYMQYARDLIAKGGMSYETPTEDECAAICMGDYFFESRKAETAS